MKSRSSHDMQVSWHHMGFEVGPICVSRVATPTKIVPYVGTYFFTLAKAGFFVLGLVLFLLVLSETGTLLV